MADFFSTSLDLVSQFTGGRGGSDHNIVQFVLAGIAWAALLALARQRQKRGDRPHERLLALGFAFGLARELVMLTMALLLSYRLVAAETLYLVFPPLEHSLHDLAMVIIAAAFMGYLLTDDILSRRYLRAGVATITLTYLATFWWWGMFIAEHPGARFGQTWCEWAFRVNGSVLMAFACLILFRQARGWQRNAVCTALLFFFLFHSLKIIDMALDEAHDNVFGPLRHSLYLIGVTIFGYIYVRKFVEDEQVARLALREKESLYRTLVENIDLGVALIDRAHRILMVNSAQARMSGRDGKHLIGCYCYWEFPKTDRICPACPGVEAMASGRPREMIKEGTRPDGSSFTVRIRAFPVPGGEGAAQGFIEVVEDITERLKAEEELQRARHLESIGVLAGGIAHDFNNILAAIFGFTDLARMKSGENSPIKGELNHIRRASERARDLVQQILMLSRRQEQSPQPFRFSSLVKEVLKLLRSTIPANIEIRQEIATEALILADPGQAHQLVLNLCTNASHAMQDRGGTLSVTLREARLEEAALLDGGGRTLPAGSYVQLTVSDTGTGIPEESLSKIFEPYFTTKEVGRGSGLGLAVVHGIVKNAGGAITVDSKPRVGTTFTVTLPVAHPQSPVEETEATEEAVAGSQERIMIVDDEENICLLSFTFLSQAGYQVDTFLNGLDAWEAFVAEPHRWDLVVTDQAMPEMTGVQLAEKILPIRPDLPVVLSTGFSEQVNRETAAAMGFRGYLQKPVVREELLRTVRQILQPGTADS